MNLPFDSVIHILEYVGDYENLLFLDKKTASIFQNIDLHKLYVFGNQYTRLYDHLTPHFLPGRHKLPPYRYSTAGDIHFDRNIAEVSPIPYRVFRNSDSASENCRRAKKMFPRLKWAPLWSGSSSRVRR